jgi:hypothetical protein
MTASILSRWLVRDCSECLESALNVECCTAEWGFKRVPSYRSLQLLPNVVEFIANVVLAMWMGLVDRRNHHAIT